MKKYAIAITGFKKPRYLYVALTALSKCIGIEKWDVIVYLDGGALGYSICTSIMPVRFVPRPCHFGNKWNIPTSMLDTFLMGYEKVVYMDEDNLLCSTALEYLLASTSKAEFISTFYKAGTVETNELQSMHANLINRKADCESMVSFLREGKYIGRTNVLNGMPIPKGIPVWDIPAFCWFRDEGHKTKWADKPYCLNFGVCGMNFSNPGLEARMFAGPRSGWLESVLMHNRTSKDPAFIPADFVYE